jgi:hypothetical protein
MHQFKTTNIKGKPYVEVNERLKYFRSQFTDHALTTEVVQLTPDFCVLNAIITDANGRIVASGMAQEDRTSSAINKTSYVENCETSAWGRALANFGIGLETSIASADEMAMAIEKEQLLTELRVRYGQLLMQKVADPKERYKLEARENWDVAKYESGIKYLLTL